MAYVRLIALKHPLSPCKTSLTTLFTHQLPRVGVKPKDAAIEGVILANQRTEFPSKPIARSPADPLSLSLKQGFPVDSTGRS